MSHSSSSSSSSPGPGSGAILPSNTGGQQTRGFLDSRWPLPSLLPPNKIHKLTRGNLQTIVPLTWRMRGHGVSTTAPAVHAHTCVAYNSCLFIYGGCAKDNRRIADIYKYSLATESWSRIDAKGSTPEARSGHTAVVRFSLSSIPHARSSSTPNTQLRPIFHPGLQKQDVHFRGKERTHLFCGSALLQLW